MSNTNRTPRLGAARWVVSIVVAIAVVAAVAIVVSRTTDEGSSAPVTTASPLSPQTVSKGDLLKTSKADGTLEYSDTLTVWHRIAGEKATASSTGGSNSSGATANGNNVGANNQGAPGGGPARAAHVAPIASARPAQGEPPSSSSTPSTTTCAPSSSTTAPPSTGGIAPAAVAVDPCSTPGGNNGGGAVRPGGGAFSGGVGSSAQATRVTQIVTSITSVGTTVENGDVLYTIDSQPVVALIGALPEWRTLSTSSTAGADIAQLEQALVELGYDRDGTVTVDETFDAQTEAMVKRWQTGLGLTATGKVLLGSVVFIPRASTVATVKRKVGDSVGDADEMLSLAGKSQRIVIDVPTGDEEFWVPGLSVTIGDTTGKVALLQSVTRNSTAIVQAVIVPDTLMEGVENGATRTVTAELVIARDVFVIPSQALVSRVDGSYALQVVGKDGEVSWQPVELKGVAGLHAGVLPVDASGNIASSSSDGSSTSLLEDGASVLAPSA